MINECQNTTDRVCETPEKIEDFVRNMQVTLFRQKMIVNDKIYEDSAKFKSKDGDYFPVEFVSERVFSGVFLKYNPSDLAQKMMQIQLGIQKVIYDDSYFQPYIDYDGKILETLSVY